MTPRDDELPVFFETNAAIRASHEYGPGGLLEWELEEDPVQQQEVTDGEEEA